MTGLKCNILASSPKTWPHKQGNLSVSDEKCRTVATLERCVLNTGSFACKIVRGEVQLAVERRGTLNTGGRNHKLDCSSIHIEIQTLLLEMMLNFVFKILFNGSK